MDSPKKHACYTSKRALLLVELQNANGVLGFFRVDQEPKSTWSASFPSPAPLSLFRLVPLFSISFSIGWLVVLLTRDSFFGSATPPAGSC